MNLYELTLNAIQKVNAGKTPDPKWIAEIDPVLEAYGQLCIGRNRVYDAVLSGDKLYISMVWTRSGFLQTANIELPVSVLQSVNPPRRAKIERKDLELRLATERLRAAERDVAKYSSEVEVLRNELMSIYVYDFIVELYRRFESSNGVPVERSYLAQYQLDWLEQEYGKHEVICDVVRNGYITEKQFHRVVKLLSERCYHGLLDD